MDVTVRGRAFAAMSLILAEGKRVGIDAIADPERVRKNAAPVPQQPVAIRPAQRRQAALRRVQNLATRRGTVAKEQDAPADLFLREPR
jgi:hypothetical protein